MQHSLENGAKMWGFWLSFFFRREFFAFPTRLDLLSWQFFAMWWKSQFFTTIWENIFACAQLGQSTKSIISAVAGVWWQVLLDKSWTQWSRWEWRRSYGSISRILWSMLIEYCFGQSGANYTLRSFSNIWQEGDVRMRVYLAQRAKSMYEKDEDWLSYEANSKLKGFMRMAISVLLNTDIGKAISQYGFVRMHPSAAAKMLGKQAEDTWLSLQDSREQGNQEPSSHFLMPWVIDCMHHTFMQCFPRDS